LPSPEAGFAGSGPAADAGAGLGGGAVDVDASSVERGDEQEIPARRRGKAGRFAYPPQLLLLDGGKGQLGVGERVLEQLGLTGTVSLAALAKQFEEVYVPGRPDPVRIPRDTEAIYLLQQIRDEAHRFAISFHRERRGRRMTRSVLDDVKGLGPARRRRLVAELGGVRGVQAAALDDLTALSWLPDEVARAVYDRLHGRGLPLRAVAGTDLAGEEAG
jgi:excinuclease ABC subunit C